MNKKIQDVMTKICDDIRDESSVSFAQSQPYVLGFMFFKFLSEKITDYVDNRLLKGKTTYKELNSKSEYYEKVKKHCMDSLGFFVEYKDTYWSILEECDDKTPDLADRIQRAFIAIQDSTIGFESNKDFSGLFTDIQLNATLLGDTTEKRNESLFFFLRIINKYELSLSNMDDKDTLGDAYEYLIGKYAYTSMDEAGQFFTPSPVSRLLAMIATHGVGKNDKLIYDPTCGSGSLLLKVKDRLENYEKLLGQEKDKITYSLARMNMILHGVNHKDFDIENGNTLTENKLENYAKKIDIVVANPPFSTGWKPEEVDPSDERFNQCTKKAPKSFADYAFIQHMIYMAKEGGKIAVIIPHGVLFRDAEAVIRKYLVEEKKYLRSVIGLPVNMFLNASISACILVFEKTTKDEPILFIEASKEFEKAKAKNTMSDENINKIFDVYKNKKEIDKFSRLVSLEEIKENDCNLNITRYIDTFEDEEEIDIDEVNRELNEVDEKIKKVEKEIQNLLKEILSKN